MRAVVWTAFGGAGVLKVREVEKPVPKKGELLIKVHASAVTTGDCRMRSVSVPRGLWLPSRLAFGVFRPRREIFGMDFSGEVVGIGQGVSLFKEGDRVFGTMGMALGANAQYLCIAERKALVKIPDAVSYVDAVSLIFGGLTALYFLKDRVKRGQQVLINGASGSVGTAAVQLAKHYGAEVTAVSSAKNHALLVSMGADEVVDYRTTDILGNGAVYEVILDAVGNLSFPQCEGSLFDAGSLILINASLGTILRSLINPQLVCGVAPESKAGLQQLLELFEANVMTSVIDKVYPLDSIVEAHEYVDTGRKIGNVVLTMV